METKLKFKSKIGIEMTVGLILYHLLIVGLFILNFFLYKKDLINGVILFLFIPDFIFFIPLVLNTGCILEDETIFVYQWPFLRVRIKYADIFEVDNKPTGKIKHPKSAALAKQTILIGYNVYEEDKDTKKERKVKKYIEISPKDIDLFYIKMGGKFQRARDLAAKLEEEHKQKNAEHYRKKEIADKTREEKAEANKPVDVKITPTDKANAKFKVEEETKE